MKGKAKWVAVLAGILGVITIGMVFFLFGFIFYQGKEVMSFEFLLSKPAGMPLGTDGGIYPALVGSIYLGALSSLAGGIIGVFAAIFLAFYGGRRLSHTLLRISVAGLSGIPSILFGLMGYTLLVYSFGMKRSLLTASITVSAMIVPYVTIRAHKIFAEKTRGYVLEAQQLGMTKEYAIFRIALPDALPECFGTVALAMTYGIGAVAPILYTGVVMHAGIPQKLTDPFMSLPYHLYMLVTSGYSEEYAYATAFVLLAFLLLVHGITKGIFVYKERKR